MDEKEMLQLILSELRVVQQDVKELKSSVENGFKQTREEIVTAIEAVGDKIDEIESATVSNSYRLSILDGKRKA